MPVIDKGPVINATNCCEDAKNYFPEYITSNKEVRCGYLKYGWFKCIEWVLRFFVFVFLTPRISKVGNLNREEVEKVYNREAKTYNLKHGLTTCGQDAVYRRAAGYVVLNFLQKKNKDAVVLDLCTGTGLAIKETIKVLSLWAKKIKIIGLDFNDKMLYVAKKNPNLASSKTNGSVVTFVKGDVTDMVEKPSTGEYDDLTRFSPKSFDVITQVFGIGAIKNPLKNLEQVLQLLVEKGQYYMADMHKPILSLCGKWFFLAWMKMPKLELFLYKKGTIPLVLGRLWGWRDTAALFYLIRLITIYDESADKYFGFETVFFKTESKRWWWSLPIMPVAEILVEKVEISKEEAKKRKDILSKCIF